MAAAVATGWWQTSGGEVRKQQQRVRAAQEAVHSSAAEGQRAQEQVKARAQAGGSRAAARAREQQKRASSKRVRAEEQLQRSRMDLGHAKRRRRLGVMKKMRTSAPEADGKGRQVGHADQVWHRVSLVLGHQTRPQLTRLLDIGSGAVVTGHGAQVPRKD